MPRFVRPAFFLAACLTLALLSTPALAKTHHHHRAHHTRHHAKISSSGISVRSAQEHLNNLGYYQGKADGKMGPRTRQALKNFQRDHGLKVDGVLGAKTWRALRDADHRIGSHSFKSHEWINGDLPAQDVGNSDFAPSMNGGTRKMNSRYASVDINESGTGANKAYTVTVNGQTVLAVDGQPAVISISPTYDLGNEDVMVFVSYSAAEANCPYHTHILMLNNQGSKMSDIDHCTRAYTARVDDDSLYLTFPERDDNRAVGATYRIEGLSVERL